MANIPQKSNDPAQQTLSAIEEALRMREPESVRTASAPREQADDLFQDEVAAPSWSEDRPRPANDDREAIGKILQTLQRRPSRTPYLIATTFSTLWVIGGAAFAFLFRSRLAELLAQPDVAAALITATAAAIILPVAIAFALAQTIRRTQELRNVAQTMAEVTMRLYEPETAAREQIVNVGQAVRREVAAMGDGIERALARAAELEALVHNEVSALERAYNDNEVRIRDLLGELTNQRDTLVSQADQIRNAISSVHLGLSHEIGTVGDVVADRVTDVAQRVTRSLTEKGEHITMALGRAGDAMITRCPSAARPCSTGSRLPATAPPPRSAQPASGWPTASPSRPTTSTTNLPIFPRACSK